MKKQVFLGGSCGNTTWRKEIAIPMLERANISYYNPQVPENEWKLEMRFRDINAKEEADVFLFVIDKNTRGVASVGEVCYLIGQKKPIALALMNITESTIIDNKNLSSTEIDDLNRGRVFIKDIASANNIPLFENVQDAVFYSIELAKKVDINLTEKRLNEIISKISYKDYSYSLEIISNGFLIQLKNAASNIKTGVSEEMFGRKWYINERAEELEIIKTLFMAIMCWEEHETRELFKYNGKVIFDPHVDLL